MDKLAHAPVFEVEPRKIVAVEHPMVVKNLENGIRTFGNNRPFIRVSLLFVPYFFILDLTIPT